jgi:hypothetical protein
MSIIVKLSDGSRIRVKGVNSEEQLRAVLSERIQEREEMDREQRSRESRQGEAGKLQGVGSRESRESRESVGYDDWRQVYNEEIRRGLCDGQRGGGGRKNEPTGKAKPKRMATARKWFRGGTGYDWSRE